VTKFNLAFRNSDYHVLVASMSSGFKSMQAGKPIQCLVH